VNARPGARIHSLCGTSRRVKKKAAAKLTMTRMRPCRHHAIWACQGAPDRGRRLAESPR